MKGSFITFGNDRRAYVVRAFNELSLEAVYREPPDHIISTFNLVEGEWEAEDAGRHLRQGECPEAVRALSD